MIWFSYMAIPALLAYLLMKMKVKLQYNWIIWMFVAFIFGCGMTHFMGIVVFYNPMYRLDGVVKLVTGIISVATVIALAWLVPKALSQDIPENMKRVLGTFNRHIKLYYLLVAALVIMVGADVWGLTNINNLKTASYWRVHTHESLQKIDNINESLAEAESAERGFIITANKKYEDRLKEAEKKLIEKLDELEQFVEDNPTQSGQVVKMKVPIKKRLKQLDDIIILRKRDGLEKIIKLLESNRDQPLLDEIHKLQSELYQEENLLLTQRNAKMDNAMQTVVIVNISASVVGVIIIGFVFIIVIRQSHTLQKAHESLKISEQQLEDINTQLIITNIELDATNKELAQFAYVASHDLKAPLRGINSLAGWIEEDLGDGLDETTKKHLHQMKDRTQRMNALIEGILQYSRIGRLYVDRKSVNLNELVASVWDGLEKKQFVFKAPPLPTIVGNPTVIEQLFGNLIENSIKHHTRDNGHIRIGVKDLGGYYEFMVKDDGPGIAKEVQNKLFVMFQTLGRTGGTGMGLALCKKIVEEVGGKIWVESDAGKGASFYFTWPKYLKETI